MKYFAFTFALFALVLASVSNGENVELKTKVRALRVAKLRLSKTMRAVRMAERKLRRTNRALKTSVSKLQKVNKIASLDDSEKFAAVFDSTFNRFDVNLLLVFLFSNNLFLYDRVPVLCEPEPVLVNAIIRVYRNVRSCVNSRIIEK